MTTTPCTGCAVQQGTHQPAEALHQIAEPDAQHLQELAAYRFTVENLRARVAELEARLEIDHRHPYDGIAARDATIKAQDERIAELESQLDAIGAGGVEPLRKQAAAPQAVQAKGEWTREVVQGSVVIRHPYGDSYEFPISTLAGYFAHPTQQGLEQDAARYQALVESGNFAPSPFDNGMWGLRASSAPSTKSELDAAVDRVLAAQAKQGEQP